FQLGKLYDFDFFFFFQAEDGIRDKLVTGVQTCALPICAAGRASTDALRLINHQKFIKDKHEILYIREKFAPRARAFPPPRRWPGASIFRRQSGATEERVLVTNRGFFRSARQRRSQNSTTQRIAIAPSGAHPT